MRAKSSGQFSLSRNELEGSNEGQARSAKFDSNARNVRWCRMRSAPTALTNAPSLSSRWRAVVPNYKGSKPKNNRGPRFGYRYKRPRPKPRFGRPRMKG